MRKLVPFLVLALTILVVALMVVFAPASSAETAGADPTRDACTNPAANLGQITEFVKQGCYSQPGVWAADAIRRQSTRYRGENPAVMAHHFLQVHYSPEMAQWLRTNRNQTLIRDGAPIPDGATMVAEVYPSSAADGPMEILSMVRKSGSWFFGRYLPATSGTSERALGGLNYASCRGCHAFAGKAMIYGNYANIEGVPWTPSDKTGAPANDGVNDPMPDFQRGDELSQPLADDAQAVVDFLDFYSEQIGQELPLLSSDDIIAFPPQSLDQVHPGDAQADEYPITCPADECFITSDYCQGCHSSSTGGTVDDLPQMSYLSSNDEELYANWSMYGEWSASIMALAARDPIWQGQVENEVNANPGVDPDIIQNACFTCHGIMGKRQIGTDHDTRFNLFNFFSTLQPNDAGYENPYPDEDGSQPEFAEYGAQARDGVSCEACHKMSPSDSSGNWDGSDYSVFYGDQDDTLPQRENPPGPPFQFTALYQFNQEQVLGPDPLDTLNTTPMTDNEGVAVNQALDESTDESYLRSSLMCGTCHVLIVPKIPTGYTAGGTIPEEGVLPYYDRPGPGSCPPDQTTWADDGNPVTDGCVGLSYEQTTYFEWLNSGYPTFGSSTTCQGCHMPLVNDPTSDDPNKTIVAQFEDDTTTKKQFRRHRLLGINLFVHEMYQQFLDLLGVTAEDSSVPSADEFVKHNLLNAEQSIVDHATSQSTGVPAGGSTAPVEIMSFELDQMNLEAVVEVTNKGGHKFPTGAGFRRGFIRFEVLDAGGEVLWVSGQPNKYGAICDGVCNDVGSNILESEFTTDASKFQPHYETITSEDQVQIYQIAEVDDLGEATSKVLSLFHAFKDNRILPSGWIPETACAAEGQRLGLDICTLSTITAAECDPDFLDCDALDNDPYYSDQGLAGADLVTYMIPLSEIPGTPATVRASVLYQTIPPGYLAARYKAGLQDGEYGDASKRVIYMTSHLNLDLGLRSTNTTGPTFDIVNDDWTMMLSLAESGPITPPPGDACTASETVLCLDDQPQDQRFKVTASFGTVLGGGQQGDAQAISLDPVGVTTGGVLYFFEAKNPEILVKVLNFCDYNGHFWVFYGAATTVGFEMTIEDTQTGVSKTYVNPDLVQAQPVIDTQAFATCP